MLEIPSTSSQSLMQPTPPSSKPRPKPEFPEVSYGPLVVGPVHSGGILFCMWYLIGISIGVQISGPYLGPTGNPRMNT